MFLDWASLRERLKSLSSRGSYWNSVCLQNEAADGEVAEEVSNDVLGDLEPLPATAEQAAQNFSGRQANGENREGRPPLGGNQGEEEEVDRTDGQEELQKKFAERQQIPPIRAGIMLLLTVSKDCFQSCSLLCSIHVRYAYCLS